MLAFRHRTRRWIPSPLPTVAPPPTAHGLVADFVTLTKPRVNLLVLVTTVIGFHLGNRGGSTDLALLRQHGRRHVPGGQRRGGVQPGPRARRRRAHAPDDDAAAARPPPQPVRRDALCRGALGHRRPAAGVRRQRPGRDRCRDHAGQLRAGLHAAQAGHVAGDGHRRRPGRPAAAHRLGGRARVDHARSVGAVRDRVLLADAARPGRLVGVSRRLRTRRHPRAAGRRSRRPQHRVPDGELLGGAGAGQPDADDLRPRRPRLLRRRHRPGRRAS